MLKNEPLKRALPKKNYPRQYQQPEKQIRKNRYSDLTGLAIIILLGIIIYSNSFTCSFHLDDSIQIVHNTAIRNLTDVKALWNNYPARPVGMFTFALNYHFNQLDVRYYHLVNLIIHLINACLVWWLTLLVFSTPALKDNPVIRQKRGIAFFTALLFVSHPLATQSVTYIIQRLASMVTLFYLLSAALYVKARLTDKTNISNYLLFAGSLISALLAMLTKENALTLPFAIILFEIFFLQTKRFSINSKEYSPILLMAALLTVIILTRFSFSLSIFKPIPPTYWGNTYTITPLNYLFTQFSVIVKYIQLLILPINQTLDYDFPVSDNFFDVRTLLSFLFLSSLIVLAIFIFKRSRIISFGIFWFFLTLSVESGFIPIKDVIFEHRTYLPSVGFFLILATVIYGLPGNIYRVPAVVILVIVVIINSYLTYERNKVWKDELSLWSDNVAKTPDKATPFYNRGVANYVAGLWDKATADYSKAIGLNPKFTDAYYNRGNIYAKHSQWDKALGDYSAVIGIDPKYSKAFYNRGNVYGKLGQWDKAITEYSRAIEIDPKATDVYYNRGVAYWNLKQFDKAIEDYSMVIGIDSNYTDAYYNRGVAYRNLGQEDKAIADFTSAQKVR